MPFLRRHRQRDVAAGICRCATNGMRVGVGLPIISVSIAMVLWKVAVLRMPPFHQPSYGPPERIVAPPFPSSASRVCIAAPSDCSPRMSTGSRLKL